MKFKDINKTLKKRYAVLVLTVLIMSITVAGVWSYGFGYSVYSGDVLIGCFPKESYALSVADTILAEDGIDVSEKMTIRYEMLNDGYTSIDEACDNLRKHDERFEGGFTLVLDGDKILTVDSEAVAEEVKNEVLAFYAEESAELHFIQNIEIISDYVAKGKIATKDEAVKILLSQANIESVIKLSYYEAIPYETVTVEDEGIYPHETFTENEGVTGEKYVEHTTYKINGVFESESITGEQIITESENRVIRKGIKEYAKGVATGSFMNPAEGYISSYFGPRWGRMHKGIDIAAPTGTPIYASDGGKVIYAGWMSGYGYLVQIDHNNGYVTYYAHCSKLHVNVGDSVARGELIADMGSTGNSTGPHLHFEVRLDNVCQNPINYVKY